MTKNGTSVDPTKVEATVNWPRPVTMAKVKSFLGMTGYYRRFVKDFSKLITRLIHKNTKFE